MKVKISFTVDLDEVPKKVDEAVRETFLLLDQIKDGHLSSITNNNILESMRWIDNSRKLLLKVDTRMLECHSMLAGYNKAIAESYMPQEQPAEQEEEQNGDS